MSPHGRPAERFILTSRKSSRGGRRPAQVRKELLSERTQETRKRLRQGQLTQEEHGVAF